MYKRSRQGWQKHLDFILLDLLCGQIAVVLACAIRYGFSGGEYDESLYRNLAIWVAIFGVMVTVLFNTMHDVTKRSALAELRQTIAHCLLVFGAVVVYLFSVKQAVEYSRIVLWLMLGIYCVLGYAVRMFWKRVVINQRRGEGGRAMLLITEEASAHSAIERFREHPQEKISLCGAVLVDRDATGESIDDVPVVAGLDSAAGYICREWIDEVYVGVGDTALLPTRLIRDCREMGVTLHLQLLSLGQGQQTVEKIAGMPVITTSINVAEPFQLLLKRVMDLLGGLLLLPPALLAIAIVGPAIKRQSAGPILYAQERIGQNGRKFRMYKIRSMHVNADDHKTELMDQNRMSDGMMFKMDFDPRVIGNRVLPDGTRKTGIGEFIRKYSIDELPQCFNLLLGNMSLVGTRPPTVDEWEKYELHHRARLAAKPGMTGTWQVQGRSKITDFEEITRLDTEYIANWNLWLDIKILFKTIWVVIQRKGAM